MDNNISDLLNKVLSNPEMLDKVTTMLPAVSALMGGGNEKKIVETVALPDKPENSTPQDDIQSSPSISIERLIANENVTTAFKNLIIAINAAQSEQNNPNTQKQNDDKSQASQKHSDADTNTNSNSNAPESRLSELLSSLSAGKSGGNANKNDAVPASTLGSMLGSLFSNSSASSNNINMSETSESTNSNEISESQPNISGSVEKALESLKNFSSVTGPEKDERVKLLLALKPFLKGERQGKVDTAIKYMSVAKIINLFGKNGFV